MLQIPTLVRMWSSWHSLLLGMETTTVTWNTVWKYLLNINTLWPMSAQSTCPSVTELQTHCCTLLHWTLESNGNDRQANISTWSKRNFTQEYTLFIKCKNNIVTEIKIELPMWVVESNEGAWRGFLDCWQCSLSYLHGSYMAYWEKFINNTHNLYTLCMLYI